MSLHVEDLLRYAVLLIALVLGFATASLASGPSPTVTRSCPHGFRLRQRRAHGQRTYLCIAQPRTVTVAAPTVTTSATVTAPGATTILQAAPLPAVTTTTPALTETVTLPATTETTTITQPATTVTTTITDTVGASAPASLAWCGGHGGNWSDNNCDAPPSPLSVPTGGVVDLGAATTGSLVSEPFPLGYLTFTVAGPSGAVWSEFDQAYGLNPAASQNCSRVENFSGQAEGMCQFVFGTPGSYVVSVGFVDTDGVYGYPAPISTTLNVG